MSELAYAPSRLSEATPSQLGYDMAKRVSSLIVDTNQVIVFPKNGSASLTQGTQGQNEIEFGLASTPYMIDPQSAHLLMDIQLTFAGNANDCSTDRVVPQDSICPWFYLIRSFVNGGQLESITDADLLAHLLTWHVGRDTYNTKASFANPGLTRWRTVANVQYPDSSSGGIPYPPTVTQSYEDLANSSGWHATGATQGGTSSLVKSVAIPLQWLGLFSGSAYLPPQVGGNIQIKFTTNQISRIFCQLKTDGATPNTNQITNMTFSNIRLVYKSVQVADEVLMMIGDMASRGPLHLPCVHHRVQQDATNLTAGAVSGPSQYNFVLATSNLVSLYHYFLEAGQLAGTLPLIYNKNPGFGPQTSSYYAEIGGKQFPSVNQAQGPAIMWVNYSEAVAGPLCLEQAYYFPVQATQGSRSGAFRLGLSMERLLGAVGDGVSAGYSTKNAAGLVRLFIYPGSSPVLVDGTAGTGTLAPSDRLVTVARYMEYILISAAGVSSTNIGS